jgi:hypothetical protein
VVRATRSHRCDDDSEDKRSAVESALPVPEPRETVPDDEGNAPPPFLPYSCVSDFRPRESQTFLREVNGKARSRRFCHGFRGRRVLSLCKLDLALGRALKTTNPAALASFAAGATGAGLDGAVVDPDWLDLRQRVFLTHGWPRRPIHASGANTTARTSLLPDASGRLVNA